MQRLYFSRGGIVALATIIVAVGASGAPCIEFWLSETDAVDGSVTQSNPTSLLDEGAENQQLHVWVRPDNELTLRNVSLNLRSTNPDVIKFTNVVMHNPQLAPGQVGSPPLHRFEFATGDAGVDPVVQDDLLPNFTGVTIANSQKSGAGLGPATQPVDTWYDSVADAFLLATVTYDYVGFGGTELFLQIGSSGLNQVPPPPPGRTSADEEVVFGGSVPPDPSLNGQNDRSTDSATADGAIVTSWWINTVNRSDVDNDLSVLPLDALLVINELNNRRISNPADNTLPDPDVFGQDPPPFVDVSGDRLMTPLDALLVINDINRQTIAAAASAAIEIGASPSNYSVPEPATSQLALSAAAAAMLLGLRVRSRAFGRGGRWPGRSAPQ